MEVNRPDALWRRHDTLVSRDQGHFTPLYPARFANPPHPPSLTITDSISVSKTRPPNVSSTLFQRLRRWYSVGLTFGERFVLLAHLTHVKAVLTTITFVLINRFFIDLIRILRGSGSCGNIKKTFPGNSYTLLQKEEGSQCRVEFVPKPPVHMSLYCATYIIYK